MIDDAIARVEARRDLPMDEVQSVFESIMRGEQSPGTIARLLTALKEKGATVDEVAGAASALRRHMTPIKNARSGVIDTCGPGGHRSGTFNISTTAALVTAAAGVPVAKHGNRSVTSKSGSADVLAELGVNVAPAPNVVERCLDELGVCFCFAPSLHPAMKHVAAVRRSLSFPTIFNLLGPLCNPAGAPFQLMGVGKPELRPLLAAALARLGVQRAVVAFGEDGIGEVSLAGPTQATEIVGHELREFVWTPQDFGLKPAGRQEMLADDPQVSAAIVRRVLAGEQGPPRDIVVLNAAAALWVAGKTSDPTAAAKMAAAAIDDGSARRLLERLVETTNSPS